MKTEITCLIHYTFAQSLNIILLLGNNLFWGKGHWDLGQDPTLKWDFLEDLIFSVSWPTHMSLLSFCFNGPAVKLRGI